MARVRPVEYEETEGAERAEYDRVVRELGRMTNMKRTLLHSLPSFRALMEWYPLREAVVPILGQRLTDLFTHAISAETDCLICSLYFRRALVEAGQDPDDMRLDPQDEALLEFGRCLGRPGGRVPRELYERLAQRYSEEQMVAITAFGAMMVATNVFNNALEVDLDDYLKPYQGAGEAIPGETSA
jgi:hypothetical protein